MITPFEKLSQLLFFYFLFFGGIIYHLILYNEEASHKKTLKLKRGKWEKMAPGTF